MRIRRFLLAGVLVGCATIAVVPQSAFAATDHNKEVFECVEKAIEPERTSWGEPSAITSP